MLECRNGDKLWGPGTVRIRLCGLVGTRRDESLDTASLGQRWGCKQGATEYHNKARPHDTAHVQYSPVT